MRWVQMASNPTRLFIVWQLGSAATIHCHREHKRRGRLGADRARNNSLFLEHEFEMPGNLQPVLCPRASYVCEGGAQESGLYHRGRFGGCQHICGWCRGSVWDCPERRREVPRQSPEESPYLGDKDSPQRQTRNDQRGARKHPKI